MSNINLLAPVSLMKCLACHSESPILIDRLFTEDCARKVSDYTDPSLTYTFIKEVIRESMSSNSIDAFEIYRCPNCALEFSNPMVLLENIYTRLYKNSAYPERWEFSQVLKKLQERHVESLFEIGCGKGIFLSKVKSIGINCFGIDLSQEAIELCRQQGLNAKVAETEEIGSWIESHYKKTWVDTFVVFQVFEHLAHPAEFLSHIGGYLQKNGCVFISVPSSKRPQKKLEILESFDYPPHHLTRWTEKAFEEIAKNSGFRLVEIIYEPLHPNLLEKQISRQKVYTSSIYKSIDKILKLPILERKGTSLLAKLAIIFRQALIFYCLKSPWGKNSSWKEDELSGESMLAILEKK
jgi:2-polyprenyl-3-methyl-5-hydroxy-6-metoxy-1,4-benzoquinol methylase